MFETTTILKPQATGSDSMGSGNPNLGMDLLSLSVFAAGFLGLAIQITQILQTYVDSVRSTHEEAQKLLTDVAALAYVLEDIVKFLGSEDLKGRSFDKTSLLLVSIEVGRSCLERLFAKLTKIRDSFLIEKWNHGNCYADKVAFSKG